MSYIVNKEQIASVKNFISKIPESIVKSKYEKWMEEIEPLERITTDQMENFVGLALNLPVEVQAFPQAFSMAIKNTPNVAIMVAADSENKDVDLLKGVNESIAKAKAEVAPKEVKEVAITEDPVVKKPIEVVEEKIKTIPVTRVNKTTVKVATKADGKKK